MAGGGEETRRKIRIRGMERHNKERLLSLLSLSFKVDQMQSTTVSGLLSCYHRASPHNCFNPLSLFELCFPIDWRLLVDWDISNIG